MYQVQARVNGTAPTEWQSSGVDLPTFYVDAVTESDAISKANDIINPRGVAPKRAILSLTVMRMTEWYGEDITAGEPDTRTPEEKEAALNRGVAVLSARLGHLLMPPPK